MRTRTEWRDGRLFTVTVLPSNKPPKNRSRKTRFHYKDVGKAGDVAKPAPPKPIATKFPFKAEINGEPVIVWPDWIERPDDEQGDFYNE